MSISWGQRKRFRFDAAGNLKNCLAPRRFPAVYALTYQQDAVARPKAHTVLYFGESADVSVDVVRQCNTVRERWLDKGGTDSELFLFYHSMPDSNSWQRESIQDQLIAEYDPLMNSEN